MENKIVKSNIAGKCVSTVSAYIIAIFIAVTTGGAWANDVSISFTQEHLLWWLLSFTIVATMVLFVVNYKKDISLNNFVKKKILLFIICCVTYFCEFKGDFKSFFSFFFLTILWFFIFLHQIDDYKLVWRALVNVVVIYALISLFFYFFGTCIHLIPDSGRTSVVWGTWTESIRTFHNIYYESQFLNLNDMILIPRNCGIYPEGPMYNFVLCMALASELFISKKVHYWKCIVLIITIITTFSTTGYLFLIIATIFYIANIIFSKKENSIHKLAFLLLAFLGVLVMLGILIQKLETPSGAGSVDVRSDHLIACFKAWLESPINGVGFDNLEAVLSYAQFKQGMSMGIAYLIACGGILLSSLLFVPYIINGVSALKRKNYEQLIFETLFLFLYFFTAVTIYPILRFFIAYIIIFSYQDEPIETRTDRLKEKICYILQKNNYSISVYIQKLKTKKKYILSGSIGIGVAIGLVFGISGRGASITTMLYSILAFFAGGVIIALWIYFQLIWIENKK